MVYNYNIFIFEEKIVWVVLLCFCLHIGFFEVLKNYRVQCMNRSTLSG